MRLKKGVKWDEGKPAMDLLPPNALLQIAKVFEYGARKYAPRNWELGMDWGRIYGAMQRHSNQFWAGEDYDEESGLPHLVHLGFNALVLLEFFLTHAGKDTRTKLKVHHVKLHSVRPRGRLLSKPVLRAKANAVPSRPKNRASGVPRRRKV